MPPILMAFFVLVGLGSAAALTDKQAPIWGKVDRSAHNSGRLEPVSFFTSMSAPYSQIAVRGADGREMCEAVVFAVSGGQRRVRVQIDGEEQEVGWSWGKEVRANPATRRNVVVRYLDPVGGRQLACHTKTFVCEPASGWDGRLDAVIGAGEPCADEAGAQAGVDQQGAARLELPTMTRVMSTQYVPGITYLVGTATLVAEIRGYITEEWYCPRVVWEFPLEPGPRPLSTRKSMHEEDCAPYEAAAAQKMERRLVNHVTLPEGRWTITLNLYHSDHLVARESTTVIIGSEDPNNSPYGPWW